MIKVGDIIDGKRVTRVYELCGGLAYQSEPVREIPDPKADDDDEPVKPKRGRKKA